MIINGIKLSYELRDILLAGFAWLTNDHIDAAQHLIKELNPRVGCVNYIAATHHSRFATAHDANHAIQCHNIGLHWVTSNSISGKVVIYESLYKTVNQSLKWQLVYTYSYVKMMVLLTSQLFCNVQLQLRKAKVYLKGNCLHLIADIAYGKGTLQKKMDGKFPLQLY